MTFVRHMNFVDLYTDVDLHFPCPGFQCSFLVYGNTMTDAVSLKRRGVGRGYVGVK